MQGQDYIFALNFAMCYDNYINCFAMNMAFVDYFSETEKDESGCIRKEYKFILRKSEE